MSTVSIANTTANVSGKTVDILERDQTRTGALTFDRDPSAPFVVTSGSAKVDNLDADKLDGQDWTSPTITTPTITTPSVNGTATFNGAVNLTSGQLAFPATQAPSAGVNTLDDYEEGTWTPAFLGSGGQSGQAYTAQTGSYIKVGKKVFCSGDIILSTLGTITSTVFIGGLPFTTATSGARCVLYVGYWTALTTSVIWIGGYTNANDTSITLTFRPSAGTAVSTLVQGDLSNTTELIFALTYIASA